MLSRCFLDLSFGVGAFVIGLSQISFFFSGGSTSDSPAFRIGCFAVLLKTLLNIHVCKQPCKKNR